MSLNKLAPYTALLLLLPSAARAGAVTRAQYVMGTVLEITAEGGDAERAVTEAFAEVVRWDSLLSLYKKESELSRLNASAAAAPFACSPDVFRALQGALVQARASQGLFNPAVLPVLRGGKEKLALTRLEDVVLDARVRTVSFKKEGMGLTLDAYAKGLALDEAAKLLRKRKTAALMNFGGQLLAVGAPKGKRGWPVTVAGGVALALKDASASTSGNAEQPGHIVDPRTGERLLGRPAVTAVAPTGAEADAWSTAQFIAGPEESAGRCVIFEGRAKTPDACRPHVDAYEKGTGR